MLNNGFSFHLTFLLCLLILMNVSSRAGEIRQPEQRETAIAWFDDGQFEKALPVFAELAYNYPYDYLLKYYYGACLVETGKFITEAEKNLLLASAGEVPAKVSFYLGMYYHAMENWNSAQRYYNRFRNYASAAEILKTKVDELSSLCYSQVNPFISEKNSGISAEEKKTPRGTTVTPVQTDPVTGQNNTNLTGGNLSAAPDKLTADTLNVSGAAGSLAANPAVAPAAQIKKVLPSFIEFQINDKVTYILEEMFQVPDALAEFKAGAKQKKQLDSLLMEVSRLRKQYHGNMKPAIRDSLALKILNLESGNLILHADVDQHFNHARRIELEWWENADFSAYEAFTAWKDSLIRMKQAAQMPVEIPDTVVAILKDSVAVNIPVPEVSGNDQDKAAEDEISYRVQIGAYNKGIPAQRKLLFNKLEKIRSIETYVNEEGITIYTTGNLKNFEDALKLQSQVRQEGIKDAFVIALKNGKRVTLPGVKTTAK